RLTADGRKHAVKYMEAFVFGQELSAFWGDYETLYEGAPPLDGSREDWTAWFKAQRTEAAAAGKQANEDKMRGFYVDLQPKDDLLLTPGDIGSGTIADDLQTAAQVVEMLLIKDHSRMKLDARTPYDSTHAQQHRLLSISHPEDWHSASEEFRRGDYMQEDQGNHDAGLPDRSRRSEGSPIKEIEEERKR
uniref:AbiV family abortive infection protein n=1 Tax=Micrococcus luteus TaxID=1270 RepID=UPI003D703ABB